MSYFDVDGQFDDAVSQHIRRITDEAGLRVMEEVLTIIRDREDTQDDQFLALDDMNVSELYFTYIAPAIDEVENLINMKLEGENK